VSVACVSVVEFCRIEKEENRHCRRCLFFLHWLFLFFWLNLIHRKAWIFLLAHVDFFILFQFPICKPPSSTLISVAINNGSLFTNLITTF
jgi:hypothetical protein